MNEILWESPDEALRDTSGYSPTQALICHPNFQPQGGLATETSNQMRQLFGTGTAVLERMTSKSIYVRLGANTEDRTMLDGVSTLGALKGRLAPLKQRMR